MPSNDAATAPRTRALWSPRRRSMELAVREAIARASAQDAAMLLRRGTEQPFVDLREVYRIPQQRQAHLG